MQTKNYNKIQSLIEKEFPKFRKTVRKNFSLITLALLQSKSCLTPEIALNMSKINGASHKTNITRLYRFLKTKTFKTEDKEWRMFVTFILNILKKDNNLLKKDCNIPINVDYTTKEDNFLILSASIPFYNRGIPLYFSIRKYPEKKGQLDLVKMEQAFIKELRHLLPIAYKYTIVADRGFGNKRFADLCIKNNFDYILRIRTNLTVLKDVSKQQVKDLEINQDFNNVLLTGEKWETRLVSKELDGNKWYIATSLRKAEHKQIINWYEKRFNIEKMFQDEKSSGFNFENLKITSYSRFKRLFFCLSLAQAILMFVGNSIEKNNDRVKKKYPICTNVVSAFSN